MNKTLYSILLFSFFFHAIAFSQIAPCGTPASKSTWLTAFQQRPTQHLKQIDTTLYIPITIHSVGDEDGSGHYGTANLLDAFCSLNAAFEAVDIQFYLAEDIRLINNSAFNEHDSVAIGGVFMQQYDIANTINSYFIRNPASTCGYNLPWASIAVNKSCANENSSTWAHEIGHHFTLPHTFIGWEGGISYDGSVPVDYGQPAPDYVLIDYTDFKEAMWLDTLIIDTILVEKVDGSNCKIAADGFCDTPPDYLGDRWRCNNMEASATLQTDPNNEKFRSNGTFIMSYSNDNCARQFSPEQIAAMRAYVLEERPDLFRMSPPLDLPITESPQLNYPLDGEMVPLNAVELSWTPTENATRYLVEISTISSFPGARTTTFETTASNLFVNTLRINRSYYWRVRAYNLSYTCEQYSVSSTFRVVDEATAIGSIEGVEAMEVYPSLLKTNETLRLSLQTSKPVSGNIKIINLSGKVLSTQALSCLAGSHTVAVATSALSAGLYLVGLETEEGRVFKKIIVE